jgi:hypothetical protein
VRDDRYVRLLTMLAEATRARKVEWSPLTPGEWDGFVAVLPSRQSFSLGRAHDVYGNAVGWELEVRDTTDGVVDRIAAQETVEATDLDRAMGVLLDAVEESVVSRLDPTITELQRLTQALA